MVLTREDTRLPRGGRPPATPSSVPVAVIGAGPYGLSVAAHLRARGIGFRAFGTPMDSWRTRMPAGMFLKSEGFASNLDEPGGTFTLEDFCRSRRLAYGEGVPVPLDTFTAYGLAFQQRFVPQLEEAQVAALDRIPEGYEIRLDGGETLTARRVVVATGLHYFPYVPAELGRLPADLRSHSAEHHDLSRFKGQDVTVIGAGASALDLVASLDAAGAEVRLVARRSLLSWTARASRRSWKRWYPPCGLGPGWRNRFFEHGPAVFRRFSPERRAAIVRTWLGPSGAWPVRSRVERLPLLLGSRILAAEARGGGVLLRIAGPDGTERELATSHIIAATGYRVDVRRLPFLGERLRAELRAFDGAPLLSPAFESSAAGLYFVGLAAAFTFGPVMRFVLGSRFTARRLGRHLEAVAAAAR